MTVNHHTTPGGMRLRADDPARSAEQAQGRRAWVEQLDPPPPAPTRAAERAGPPGLPASLPHCGYAFSLRLDKWTDKQGRAHVSRHYSCNGRADHRRYRVPQCENPRWRAEVVEGALWGELVALIRSPEILRELADAGDDDGAQSEGGDLLALRRDLARNTDAINRVKVAYRNGPYSAAELDEELASIRQEREGLEERLGRGQSQLNERAEWEANLTAAIEYCREYQREVEDPNLAQERKRVIIETFVERAELAQDGTLDILFVSRLRRSGRVPVKTGPASSRRPTTAPPRCPGARRTRYWAARRGTRSS